MKKVLIIEDNHEIQDILISVFKDEFDFTHTIIARDGLDGFHEAQKEEYDIICSDINMPYLKGTDMVLAIRSKDGPNKLTPMVLISGFDATVTTLIDSLENVFYLEKPVDNLRLRKYVNICLNVKFNQRK